MNRANRQNRKGFTLVELLVVISIIAVIIGVSMSNLLGARGRARYAARKSNLMEMKNALRLYYNDYQSYPTANADAPFLNGCGVPDASTHVPTALCPAGCSNEFSAGSDCASAIVYMKRLPRAANGTDYSFQYFNSADGSTDDFCLTTGQNDDMENSADQEIAASQAKCATACAGHMTVGKTYVMCAD
jgi:prepilin-type N-terminal cleavage/methylation domain-containing protein